ncbi:MAG: right-handed parallel beta-helix repeat-containing protein [Patescibacteria group bacterium]
MERLRNVRMAGIVLALFAVLFLTLPSMATTRKVPSDFTTIQAAINVSMAGDTVLVATGIYSATTNGEAYPLIAKGGVILTSEDGANTTWLIGNLTTRIIDCINLDERVTIDGFRVSQGKAVGGGGIRCENAVVTLTNNQIVNCSSDSGGGVYGKNADIEFTGNHIASNYASSAGGGLSLLGGAARLHQNVIMLNSCTVPHYAKSGGGGLFAADCDLQLYGNIVDTNIIGMYGYYPEGYGAGICVHGGKLVLRGNTITRNVFSTQYNALWGSRGFGGGLYCGNCDTAAITNNIINGNVIWLQYSSDARGAGIYLKACVQPVIKNNLIAGNSAVGGSFNTGAGIGMDNTFADSVMNNTIADNVGGGVYTEFVLMTLANNIIAGNSAGVGIVSGTGSELTVQYNDVWNNANGNLSGNLAGVGDTTWGYNNNGTACDRHYNIIRDPMFSAEADSAYHLQCGSPCIDAGAPANPSDPDGTVADQGAFYKKDCPVDIVEVGPSILPTEFVLNQNYPNPFNPSTTISYDLPRSVLVRVSVFNILGQHIITLVNDRQSAGYYHVNWDGRASDGNEVSSGIYLYVVRADEQVQSKKMVLMK